MMTQNELYGKLKDICKRRFGKKPFLHCGGQGPAESLRHVREQSPEQVRITIFQAPYATLVEKGIYWEMHNLAEPFGGNIPAEYYLPVFNGKIDCPEKLPKDPEQRRSAILEHVFAIFNTAHPAGYAGRSLSVGDVVRLEGKDYLCAALGFVPVAFKSNQKPAPVPAPTVCELALPDGTRLRAGVHNDTEYPCIDIELLSAGGEHEAVCFAEYNPEKPLGHRVCAGVYRAGEDEPCYYDSYRREA